jgi:hypothetical protein
VRVIAWNVGPRSRWRILRSLRRLMRDHPADVYVLLEATRCTDALRRRHGDKYRVIRRASDVVALVSRDLPRPDVKTFEHEIDWLGPKAGIPHEGRSFLRLDWDDDRLVLVHRVPGGPKGGTSPRVNGLNREAWVADLTQISRAVGEAKRAAVIGDHNGTHNELAEDYQGLGLTVAAARTHVDKAATRGYDARCRRLGNYGSDHPALLTVLR